MSDEKNSFALIDVVNKLREDIGTLSEQTKDASIRFNVNEVEVELKTVIEEVRGGEGGFNLSVLKFGGKFDDKSSDIQTIKLKLKPVINNELEDGNENAQNDDPDVQISGRARRIS